MQTKSKISERVHWVQARPICLFSLELDSKCKLGLADVVCTAWRQDAFVLLRSWSRPRVSKKRLVRPEEFNKRIDRACLMIRRSNGLICPKNSLERP